MSSATRAPLKPALPMVVQDELLALIQRYGEPARWQCAIAVDNYIRPFRLGGRSNRRAEVVFAIEDEVGDFWVHSKRNYPANLYRLPSGGIGWTEGVEHALLREIAEETALKVTVERFLGLIQYDFREGEKSAEFASYVFHVRSRGGSPRPGTGEDIISFRTVYLSELGTMAASLRTLPGERSGWGKWRAVAHQLVHDVLTVSPNGGDTAYR